MSNFFKQKHILVTGAAGFIGSHLVDELLKVDAKVIGVDNFLTGRKKNLQHLNLKNTSINLVKKTENFQFIQADVTQAVETYLPSENKIDFIFHFASPASPPRYQAYPRETYLVNSLATDLLLNYLKNHYPQARFIFASTSEVYGDPQEHPQKENYWGHVNPNGIRSCYDESKRLGETIGGVFYRTFGIDVRIIRIFNTYGPRMDPKDGRIIPTFINQALKKEKITIYGDGSQTRAYCYIDDLIQGILKIASADQIAGQTFNLGNPQEYTVLETAEIIQKKINKQFSHDDLNFQKLPADDPIRRCPDINKIKKTLNWEAKTDFQAGLIKTINYFSINQ